MATSFERNDVFFSLLDVVAVAVVVIVVCRLKVAKMFLLGKIVHGELFDVIYNTGLGFFMLKNIYFLSFSAYDAP